MPEARWDTVSVAESRLTIRRLMIAAIDGRKTMSEKLKECPFCGGRVEIDTISSNISSEGIYIIGGLINDE